MDDALRRRLDALIVLCSALLGLAITVLVLWDGATVAVLAYALPPTALIVAVAFRYVRWA